MLRLTGSLRAARQCREQLKDQAAGQLSCDAAIEVDRSCAGNERDPYGWENEDPLPMVDETELDQGRRAPTRPPINLNGSGSVPALAHKDAIHIEVSQPGRAGQGRAPGFPTHLRRLVVDCVVGASFQAAPLRRRGKVHRLGRLQNRRGAGTTSALGRR